MIEDKLKRWIEDEIESGISSPDYIAMALNDDDDAIAIWREFQKWHRPDLIESVRTQIKAILKKNTT